MAHGVMRCPASLTRHESAIVAAEENFVHQLGCKRSRVSLPGLEAVWHDEVLLQVREQSAHIAALECNLTKLQQALAQQQSHMQQQLSAVQQVRLPHHNVLCSAHYT